MHRFTHALALLIHGGNDAKVEQDYEPIADAIDATMKGYPDEQKADLYALLAETVTPGMPFGLLCVVVDAALTNNEKEFLRG